MIEQFSQQGDGNLHLPLIENHQGQKTHPTIEARINLPQSIKVQALQGIFRPIDSVRNSPDIPPLIKDKLIDLYHTLSNSFYQYEQPQSYNFRFPDSKFEAIPIGKQNQITYQRKIDFVPENTFLDHLSPEQLEQISRKGQFEVRSNNPRVRMPYVWKINNYLFKGSEHVVLTWKQGIAAIYDTFVFGKETLITRIPQELTELIKIPKRIFSLLFGKKKMIIDTTINYERQIGKDFFSEALEQEYSRGKGWGEQFWDFLFVPYESRLDEIIQCDNVGQKEQRNMDLKRDLDQFNRLKKIKFERIKTIMDIDKDFNKTWDRNRKKIISEIIKEFEQDLGAEKLDKSNEQEAMLNNKEQKNQKKILNDFENRKYTMYLNWIKGQLPKKGVDRKVIEAIIFILNLFQLLFNRDQKLLIDIQRLKEQIKQQIKNQYPILSLSTTFYTKEYQKRFQEKSQQLRDQLYQNLPKDPDFINQTSNIQKNIYQKFLIYRYQYQQRIENKKKQISSLYKPARIFQSLYYLLPPYEIIQHKFGQHDQSYALKKTVDVTSNTSFHFWKLYLYGMRLKSWTINCFFFLISQAFLGRFGVRCLFGVDNFTYEQQINNATGVKIPLTRTTMLGVFMKVIEGIIQSRQNFEAQPDTGLFGKRFSRMCNFLECYLFRFVIVGVLIVLVLYPVAIVLTFGIVGIFAITVWLWVPFVMLLVYLFNILIYQFESSYIPTTFDNDCCCDCCGRGCCIRAFPLPSLILVIFKSLFLLIVYVFHILLTPIFVLLQLLLIILQLVLRTISDKIMYCLISCCGRTPSNDTGIAWKISGPGMARAFYNSVHEEDVYVLTQAKLQETVMNKLTITFRQRISQHHQFYNTILSKVIEPYVQINIYVLDHLYQDNSIRKNKEELTKIFDQQFNQYMKRFPRMPRNVRFTKQEIDRFFPNSVRIVKNFLERQKVGEWFFQDRNMTYGSYEQLTTQLWTQMFGTSQIFQPLQKIDERFMLVDLNAQGEDEYYTTSMKQKLGSVMQALESQVYLSKNRVKVSTFKPGILTSDPLIQMATQLCTIQAANSIKLIHFDPKDFSTPFIPHQNIQQLKIQDRYYFNRRKKDENIIQGY